MAAPNASSTKKSCCWLGHCCWLKIVFGLFVIVAAAGLYWKHMHLEREVSALANQLKKGTPAQLQTQLDTLNLLVNMANVQLKTFGDKNTAVSYLTQAKQQVQMLPETPEQNALQQALNDDTQTVTTIEIIPLETVSKKLDTLIDQARELDIMHVAADKAPVSTDKAESSAVAVITTQPTQTTVVTTPAPAAPQQNKDWQEKLQEGWTHIKSLVKSEDKGASDNPVEAWLVPAKLVMQLEEIKLAAFYRNNSFFQKLINQTVDWLGNHYDLAKNEKVVALKNELEALKNWTLTPDVNVLSKSIMAVDKLKQKSTTP